ncbi:MULTISPECIES: Lrp/AsnC family transcriptional regulator [unclassified Luteococcus]|uniref:Lrp/AsnC family transcriptional regulator n=1 Tax=unclassified Luteococcus TaxID=2639923 RepID=UPI00313CFAED
MESTDQQILALLAREGRMSYTDIGRETGLSTSAAQQRVRRLEQRGIISGYHATINSESLGRNLTAFISIRPLDPETDEATPGKLEGMPEIASCYSVAGDASYLLEVHVGTPAELDALLTRIRTAANVTTVTTVVLTTIFRDRPMLNAPAS